MTEEDINKMHYERGVRGENKVNKQFQAVKNPQLQENEFRATFLPMFVGGGRFMNTDAWRAVAGTLQNEVDVFAGTEYLYTTPPVQLDIMSVISTRSADAGMGTSFNGALHNAAKGEDEYATYMLIDSQTKQVDQMVIDKRAEYMARWDAIFKRYGIDYLTVRAEIYARENGLDPATVKVNNNEQSFKQQQDEELDFSGDNIEPY